MTQVATHTDATTVEAMESHLPAIHEDRSGELAVVGDDASLMMNPAVFEHMQRVCKVYSGSNVVPQQFQGNLANCMIAYELAYRMKVNVFMLMQSMYVVQGKPGLEAKLAIALVNTRGPFRGTIQFKMEYDAKHKPVACTAFAYLKSTGDRCETTVTWDVVEKEGWAKKGGSKWLTMPEQMFKYRAAAWLARTYCPEVLMGMSTTDELEDTYGGTRFIKSESRPLHGSKTQRLAGQLMPDAAIMEQAPAQEPPADTSATVEPSEADTPAQAIQTPATADDLVVALADLRGIEPKAAESTARSDALATFKVPLAKLDGEQLAVLWASYQEDKA